jgi:hypothetical protein
MAAHPDFGPNHPQTLNSRFVVAQILDSLGRGTEALPIAQSVAEANAAHPDRGPNHPDTITSRELVQLIKDKLA